VNVNVSGDVSVRDDRQQQQQIIDQVTSQLERQLTQGLSGGGF